MVKLSPSFVSTQLLSWPELSFAAGGVVELKLGLSPLFVAAGGI